MSKTPGFAVQIEHWPTPQALADHLSRHSPTVAAWVRGATIHHTFRPTVQQWRGRFSMAGLVNFYRDEKQWTAGPHLFLAPDGIWQLTPLNMPGVHAHDPCNSTHWGIEVVGDYTAQPWSPPLTNLVLDTLAVLFRWRGLVVSAETLNSHNTCPNNATSCPGAAVNMRDVRTMLALRLSNPASVPLNAHSLLLAPERTTFDQAMRFARRNPPPTNAYSLEDLDKSILPAYFDACDRSGVDPLLVLAQLWHETGGLSSFWSARPQRNPAGIGVTGTSWPKRPPPDEAPSDEVRFNAQRNMWERGLSFASWAGHSVPAHVGRIVAYAVRPEERTPAQRELADAALAVRDLADEKQGAGTSVGTLAPHWAADRNYVTKWLAMARRIQEA